MTHELNQRRFVLKALAAGSLTPFVSGNLARAAAAAGPLRMGYQTNLVGLVGMVTEEEKLYDAAGANVSVFRFKSGADVRNAMVSGRIDVGAVGSTPFIVGVSKSRMVGLGVVAYTGKMCMVVARKDSGLKSVADLKGKKVASQVGSQTDHAFQNKIAPKFGLEKGDVSIVNTKFENHVAALAAGSVDAFAGVDPFTAVAENSGIGVILVDYSAYDILPSILAVNLDVLQQRPNDVLAFLKGWVAGVKIVQNEPKRATAVAAKLFKDQGYDVPDAVISRAVGRVDVNPQFVPEMEAYLTEQARVLLKAGQITEMPDWKKALVREPLLRALKV